MSKSQKLVLIVFLFVCIAGCDTLNVGTGMTGGSHPKIGTVTVTSATSMNAGETGTITVPWVGATAPCTIAISIGGAALVPAGTAAGMSPYTFDFTLEEGTINWIVTMIDNTGGEGTASGTYTAGPPLNDDPTIENTVLVDGVLTVTVADTEGDDVTVTVTDITGLEVDNNTVIVPGGNGDAMFSWSPVDAFVGGTGDTTVTVADAATNTGEEASAIIHIPIPALVIEPAEGQIVAHLTSNTAGVGDTVTVLVIAGDFPAGAAFNYMNGVGISVTDGGDYVDDTFNVGSIGGAQKDVDGIWADMAPAPSTFFVPENFMMKATDVVADSTLDFMGFNITPIGAGEVTGGGDLFNFGIAFDFAGTYDLGFIEFQDVKRTYYSDNAAVEYNWTDIGNQLPNLQSSITIT